MEFSRYVWFVANTSWVSVQNSKSKKMMDTFLLHATVTAREKKGHEQGPSQAKHLPQAGTASGGVLP